MKAPSYALALTLIAIGNIANAQESTAVRMHIASASVAEAINQWAQQTGFRVVWTEDVSTSAVLPQLDGTFTPRQALERLLRNTHLQAEFPDAHTAVISRTESRTAVGRTATVRLADSTADLPLADSSSTDTAFDEVIVTAQKKIERLQDVPVSITVLNPDALAENGQTRLVDYFATVPGLSLSSNSFGGGTQYLSIRGVSAGQYQNSVVATVIDDVPTGSSNILAFGEMSPSDIDPSDLERIEVLKGPHGTLYGADSLGGLIKYVTKEPSTTEYSGRVEVDGVDVPDGGLGYAVRGAANIPVSDTFAIRVSGFVRGDPGYIDDLTTGQTNVNSADVYGGHLAALWKPSGDFSLKVSALVQKTNGHGINQIDSNSLGQPIRGDLNQTGLPGTGPYTTESQLYSATLKAKVASLDFISVTGYGINKLQNFIDQSAIYGPYAEMEFPGSGTCCAAEENHYETDKFSQELRVSSSIGRWLDWLAGGFYTHEDSPDTFQNFNAETMTGSVVGEQFLASYSAITLSEYAIFGDLTAHVTDRFDVQLGARESWIRQAYASVLTGPLTVPFYGPPPYVNPLVRSNGNAFTYLVTPEFKISPDLMVYARVASGYRIGGPNVVDYPEFPTSYKPDKTTDYELGVKGDLFDRQLTFDASAYYIDWKDVQLGLCTNLTIDGQTQFACYTGNAAGAKSEGLEGSIQTRPIKGLTITAQGSYDDAALTQNLPPAVLAYGTYGVAGDRLPYSMRWSGGLTVNQDIPLSEAWTGFVGGSLSYVGSRLAEFAPDVGTARLEFPAYTTFNLRSGARYGSLLINLYVNNAGNKRGIVGITQGDGINGGYSTTIIQPRTVGLSLVYTF
jgi:iron complex outermembrane receptor protein